MPFIMHNWSHHYFSSDMTLVMQYIIIVNNLKKKEILFPVMPEQKVTVQKIHKWFM